jgi:hypothetical protein
MAHHSRATWRNVRRACRRAALCLVSLGFAANHALAIEVPPCAPPELVVLDQATADTLAQAIPVEQDSRIELQFASLAPELTTLGASDFLLVPPTAALPSGIQAPIFDVVVGAAETTVTLLPSQRWPNPTGAGLDNLVQLLVPDAADRVCADTGFSSDDDNDGIFDSGAVAGECTRDNGGEYGFELEVADGVLLNGMVSVAPFDIRSSMEFEEAKFLSAAFTSTGRVSFSGELSATVDATFDGTRPVIIGSFPVARS